MCKLCGREGKPVGWQMTQSLLPWSLSLQQSKVKRLDMGRLPWSPLTLFNLLPSPLCRHSGCRFCARLITSIPSSLRRRDHVSSSSTRRSSFSHAQVFAVTAKSKMTMRIAKGLLFYHQYLIEDPRRLVSSCDASTEKQARLKYLFKNTS